MLKHSSLTHAAEGFQSLETLGAKMLNSNAQHKNKELREVSLYADVLKITLGFPRKSASQSRRG